MPLIPVTPTVALVSKMALADPDGTDELVRLGMYEAFCDLADAHGPRLTALTDQVSARFSDEARKAVVRKFVAARLAGADVSQFTALTERLVVAKHKSWDPSKHSRDENGRFTIMLSGNSRAERKADLEAHIDAFHRGGFVEPGTPLHVTGMSHEEWYERDANGKQTDTPDSLRAQLGDKGQGFKYLQEPPHDFDPTHLSVHEDDVRKPKAIARHRGARDFGNALIGNGKQLPGNVASPNVFGANLQSVTERSAPPDRRAYNQLKLTGQAVRALTPPGTTANAAGVAIQVSGELGAQAEAVLSPGIKRTAYRYRGTERRPDTKLRNALISADVSLQSRDEEPSDSVKLKVRGDAATDYFIDKVPNPQDVELSNKAGRIPPSQGAIIDERGEVVAEAQGAGSDHYLPFDLKNLKSLHGGQYVRTRAAGGPTSEDIYTGLMTGARQIQVVSNSGVFTLQFDPSIRGVARYSDKARSMVNRYQEILEAIKSNEVWARDISPKTKAALRQQAMNAGGDQQYKENLYKTLVEQAQQAELFSRPDDEELRAEAEDEVLDDLKRSGIRKSPQEVGRDIEDAFHAKLNQERDERARKLQLDGEGYQRALLALQGEFPYYLKRPEYESLRRFDRRRQRTGPRRTQGSPRSKDQGAVPKGWLTAHDSGQVKSTPSTGSGAAAAEPEENKEAPKVEAKSTTTPVANSRALRPFTVPEHAAADPLRDGLDLGDALTAANLGQLLGHLAPAPPDPENKPDNYTQGLVGRAANPDAYVAAVWEDQKGSDLASGTYIAGPKISAAEVDTYLRGLEKLKKDGLALYRDEPDTFTDEQFDALDDAIERVKRIKAAKSSAKQVDGDPALYEPTDDTPAHFADIEKLPPNDPEIHQQFLNAQNDTDFADALKVLSNLEPDQRRRYISDEVRAYTAAKNWKGVGPAPDNVKIDSTQAKLLASDHNPHHDKLLALQQAWAYLHKVGGASPKAPEASSLAPQFKTALGKRAEPVAIHRQGSPMAVAFAKARARNRRGRR